MTQKSRTCLVGLLLSATGLVALSAGPALAAEQPEIAAQRFQQLIEGKSAPGASAFQQFEAGFLCAAFTRLVAANSVNPQRQQYTKQLSNHLSARAEAAAQSLPGFNQPQQRRQYREQAEATLMQADAIIGGEFTAEYPVHSWSRAQWEALISPCQALASRPIQ